MQRLVCPVYHAGNTKSAHLWPRCLWDIYASERLGFELWMPKTLDTLGFLLWCVPELPINPRGVFALILGHSFDGQSATAERVGE